MDTKKALDLTCHHLQEALWAFRPIMLQDKDAMSGAIHRLIVEMNEMVVDYATDLENRN